MVFERLRQGDAETQADLLALAKHPSILKQWDAICDDYNDTGAHHAFVADCEQRGALAFASLKYGEILQIAPREEIAHSMQNQIKGLVNHRIQIPMRSAPWVARVPMLNGLVTLLSTVVLLMGIYIPHMRSMAWLGGAFLIFSLVMRYLALAR